MDETNISSLGQTWDTCDPIVTFIDDDGKVEAYTRLFPIFQAKNEKFVVAVCPNRLNTAGYLTDSQLRELRDHGHEIVNHTFNHVGYSKVGDKAVWDEDIRKAKEFLRENGYTHDILVNPYEQGKSKKAIGIMQKHAKCAFNSMGQNKPDAFSPYHIRRIAFGSWIPGYHKYAGAPLEYYKKKVDYCFKHRTWLVWMVHSAVQSTRQDLVLAQLIDYIQWLGIEIVTASEGLARRVHLAKDRSLIATYRPRIRKYLGTLFRT